MMNEAVDVRGLIVPRNVIRVENAFVEEANVSDARNSFIVISYMDQGMGGRGNQQRVRLNIGSNTVVLNSFGLPICACDLRRGMFVDALFSPAMTRSIPPQANAFLIMARRQAQPSMSVTTDRIARVDVPNNFLITGNIGNINTQTRFVVTDNTVILDRNGNRISLRQLRQGQLVRVTHANFQTASIPPQTTAFYVQVL